MRVLAITAFAATFWLLVATVRLVMHGPCPRVEVRAVPQRASAPSPPPAPSPLEAKRFQRPRGEGHMFSRHDDDDGPTDDVSWPMSKAGLIAGFNAVRPGVRACYEEFRVPGTAMVNTVIARSGRVKSAQVTGKFAGTPTGACVERAVRTARFPESDGFSTPYPFQLK